MFPKIASVQEIQRNYKLLFDMVNETGEPLLILKNNKPEVVIVHVQTFEMLREKAEKYDQEVAKKAIAVDQKEKKAGTLKKLTSLSDLIDED